MTVYACSQGCFHFSSCLFIPLVKGLKILNYCLNFTYTKCWLRKVSLMLRFKDRVRLPPLILFGFQAVVSDSALQTNDLPLMKQCFYCGSYSIGCLGKTCFLHKKVHLFPLPLQKTVLGKV